ncbi:hypothetical protein [Polaromonas sp. YR568]
MKNFFVHRLAGSTKPVLKFFLIAELEMRAEFKGALKKERGNSNA